MSYLQRLLILPPKWGGENSYNIVSESLSIIFSVNMCSMSLISEVYMS